MSQTPRLTRREREVLERLAKGKTDLEIARSLCIGERTVHTHVGNLLRKLEARNRVQVAVLWERHAGEIHAAEIVQSPKNQ